MKKEIIMTNIKKYAAVAALALALTACGNNTEEAAPADNAASTETTTEAPVEETPSTEETTTDAPSTDAAAEGSSTEEAPEEEGSN